MLAHLTYQWICDVGPVNAILQLQLVMWLDVEQQVLVETHAGYQVSSVGTLQSTATVDVLQWKKTQIKREARTLEKGTVH